MPLYIGQIINAFQIVFGHSLNLFTYELAQTVLYRREEEEDCIVRIKEKKINH